MPLARMLVAQARLEGMTLLTTDPDIGRYECRVALLRQVRHGCLFFLGLMGGTDNREAGASELFWGGRRDSTLRSTRAALVGKRWFATLGTLKLRDLRFPA
jgi:hypothetical protein